MTSLTLVRRIKARPHLVFGGLHGHHGAASGQGLHEPTTCNHQQGAGGQVAESRRRCK